MGLGLHMLGLVRLGLALGWGWAGLLGWLGQRCLEEIWRWGCVGTGLQGTGPGLTKAQLLGVDWAWAKLQQCVGRLKLSAL